jgi:hypothetical protein
MICDQPDSRNRHIRQETEANTFAIELLAPLKRIRAYLRGPAELRSVIAMSAELDISKEAAARRYVSCHPETLAVVFSRDDRFLYAIRSREFPRLALKRDLPMPALPRSCDGLSEMAETDPGDWMERPDRAQLDVQTLHQQEGYKTTLLHVVASTADVGDRNDWSSRLS